MNTSNLFLSERIDDLPLLIQLLKTLQVAPLLDHYLKPHENRKGATFGWTSGYGSERVVGPQAASDEGALARQRDRIHSPAAPLPGGHVADPRLTPFLHPLRACAPSHTTHYRTLHSHARWTMSYEYRDPVGLVAA